MLEADIQLVKSANHPTTDDATAGGASTSTEITNAATGEWITRMTAPSSGDLDDDAESQYQEAYLKNTHGADSLADFGVYVDNLLAIPAAPGVMKGQSSSASDDSSKELKFWLTAACRCRSPRYWRLPQWCCLGSGPRSPRPRTPRASGREQDAASATEQVEAAASRLKEAEQELAECATFDMDNLVALHNLIRATESNLQQTRNMRRDVAGGTKRLDDTALVVGKALSGSLEGFESLRNEYGISSAELKKYGAVLNTTGGISVRSSADLDKARQALLAIINLNFGGAIERQAQTLQGAMSNAADSIDVLFARIGDDLAPAAKLASVAFSGLVNGISGIDEGVRGAVVAGGLLSAILIGVAGASLGTVVALQALSIQLERMAAGSAAAGLSARALSGSLALLGRAGNIPPQRPSGARLGPGPGS